MSLSSPIVKLVWLIDTSLHPSFQATLGVLLVVRLIFRPKVLIWRILAIRLG